MAVRRIVQAAFSEVLGVFDRAHLARVGHAHCALAFLVRLVEQLFHTFVNVKLGTCRAWPGVGVQHIVDKLFDRRGVEPGLLGALAGDDDQAVSPVVACLLGQLLVLRFQFFGVLLFQLSTRSSCRTSAARLRPSGVAVEAGSDRTWRPTWAVVLGWALGFIGLLSGAQRRWRKLASNTRPRGRCSNRRAPSHAMSNAESRSPMCASKLNVCRSSTSLTSSGDG